MTDDARAFTKDEAVLLWTGAQVERQLCTKIVREWGTRHGVSGSAFDELVGLIDAPKRIHEQAPKDA